MSAANIAAMAAALLAMQDKKNREDPDDYEGFDITLLVSWFALLMFLIIGGGMAASLYVALTFGFWWGMVGATITGLLVGLSIFFA